MDAALTPKPVYPAMPRPVPPSPTQARQPRPSVPFDGRPLPGRPRRLAGTLRTLALLLLGVTFPDSQPLDAQAPIPIVAASGRVTTSVAFDGRLIGNIWLNRSTAHSGPALVKVDYGQPHARGREIYGGLVPWGEVWRLGANMATHLTADLNIRLGDLDVPRGTYTLYLIPRPDGAELIVNTMLGQWGTEYEQERDLGRTTMTARRLAESEQSLRIDLVPELPEEGELPTGVLMIRWGELEYVADWIVTRP